MSLGSGLNRILDLSPLLEDYFEYFRMSWELLGVRDYEDLGFDSPLENNLEYPGMFQSLGGSGNGFVLWGIPA